MRGLADNGVVEGLISSDMEEAIGVSDRTVVMRDSRIGGFLARADFSEENVMRLAVGHLNGGHLEAGQRDPAGSGGRGVLKKDLYLFLLILVVGFVVSILNPRFLLPINLGNTANLIGPFGLFSLLAKGWSSSSPASISRSARCLPSSASSSST